MPGFPPRFPSTRTSHGAHPSRFETVLSLLGSMPAALILHISSQSRSGRRHTQNFPPNFKSHAAASHISSSEQHSPCRARAAVSSALTIPAPSALYGGFIVTTSNSPAGRNSRTFRKSLLYTSRRPPREFIPAALFICSHPCSLISIAATGLLIFFLSHSSGIIPHPLPMSQQRLDSFTAAKSASRRASVPNPCSFEMTAVMPEPRFSSLNLSIKCPYLDFLSIY